MEVPKIFGRYQPIKVLGAGTNSRVMMVKDLLDNEIRALKVLLDEAGTEGFFREFEILASINHPQIIKVFDFGQDASGLRYFTMEYLPGRPLVEVVPEQLSISRIHDIATQLLSALAAIHARGILHADLKPQNIFLVEEGDGRDRIKLLDFGLAGKQKDRDPGHRRGTLPYMAPEWFQDVRADHRSDLYSAGVVIFQLLTGKTPFDGAEPSELIQLKIRDNVPSMHGLRPDCSPELVRLVNWLLERDLALRPQSATEALKTLEDESQSSTLASSSAVVLTGLPMIGRDDLLVMAQTGMEHVVNSMSGRMLLFQGDDGGGKSRMLQELKPLMQREGYKLIEARGGDIQGQPPLRQLLFTPVHLEADLHQPLLDRYQAVLQQVSSNTEQSLAAPIMSSNEALGLMDGLSSFFIELATRHALVILFDDLHRADPMTQDMFMHLGWRLKEAPLLICATVDLNWIESRDDYKELVQRSAVEVIRLNPLTQDDLDFLLRETFGTVTGSMRLAQQLEATTAGNPALVNEAIESLVDAGALFHERGRWYLSEEGAIDVLNPARGSDRTSVLLQRRIEPLSAVDRELLEAAAILGIEFDEMALLGLVGGGSWVTEALQRLEHRGLVLRLKERPERLRFQQPRLRPYLLERLPPEVYRALHRRAGEFVLASVGTVAKAEKLPDRELDELAQHFLAAADFEAGKTFGLLAAARAEQNQALRQALDRYQQLIALAVEQGKAAPPDIREKIADLQLKLGQTDEALREYQSLLSQDTPWDQGWISVPSGSLPSKARIYAKLGSVYGEQGDFPRALEALGEALALTSEDDVRSQVQFAGLRSTYQLMNGDLDAAEKTARDGLKLVGKRPLPWLIAPAMRLWIALADIATFRNQLEEAEAFVKKGLLLANPNTSTLQPQEIREIRKRTADLYFIRGITLKNSGAYPESIMSTLDALSHYEALRDLTFMGKCYNNLGTVYFCMGDWSEAIDYWERFRDIAERARAKNELTNACNNLGFMYKETGQLEEATLALEQGVKLARQLKYRVLMPTLLGNLGEVRARQGHYEEAERLYEQARQRALELRLQTEVVENMRRLAELHLEEGRLGKVRRVVNEALELARQHQVKVEEGNLLGVQGAEAAMRDMTERALGCFRKGEEILVEIKAEVERARLKLRQGLAFVKLGFPSEAETALRFAEETFRRLGAAWDLKRTQEALDGLSGEGGRGTLAFRKLQLLLDVTRALSAEIELGPLLDRILEKAIELTQTERGFVILLDADRNPVFHTTRKMARAEVETGQASQVSSTVIKRVLEAGSAIAVTNVEQEFDLRTQTSIVELGLRAIMCAPLKRGERTTGLIYVDSSRITEGFYQADVSLLEALADTAAVSLEGAQNYEALRRKTDLMSIMAHEFRSPLTASIAFTQHLLRSADSLSPEQRDSLEAIREQGYRLNRMIDNILELARMEADKVEWNMEELDIGEVVGATVRELEPLAQEKGIRVLVLPAKHTERTYGNRDRLIQVCTNLLGNALKFTPEEGRVEISTDIIEHPRLFKTQLGEKEAPGESWATRTLEPGRRLSESKFIAVRFKDTGPGILPEDLSKIFGKFEQSGDRASRSKGTGLGLAIAREIVTRHSGRLWAENVPEGGTMFVFCLPVVVMEMVKKK